MKTSKTESAVLSNLMLDPSLVNHKGVCDLAANDFRSLEAQEIFTMISVDGLDMVGLMEKTNGETLALVNDLSSDASSVANLHVYAEMVKEESEKRKTHKTLSEAQQRVLDGEDIQSVKLELIDALSSASKATDRSLREICTSYVDELEKRQEIDGFLGLTTGFEELDEIWGGMESGDLIILAARPGMGKTALALNIARHNALNNKNVQIYSLEMPSEQLVNRFVADIGCVDAGLLKRPKNMGEEDWQKVNIAMSKIIKMPVDMSDEKLNLANLLSSIRRKAIESKPDLIVVDYLQLIDAGIDNRVQEITKISGALKGVAIEMGCPVIALSQLSRKVEERPVKIPNNSDLRDSGSIEQDADKIAFIYRDEVYNEHSESKGLAEIITTKNRSGECGSITLEARLKNYQFRTTNQRAQRTTPSSRKRGFDG